MAVRYIGDAVVRISYHDSGDYHGTVSVPAGTWRFGCLHAPACGFGPGVAYYSPAAYDEMASSAVAFASYYTSHNRGDETPDWAPPPELADAIDAATCGACSDGGDYTVRRKE